MEPQRYSHLIIGLDMMKSFALLSELSKGLRANFQSTSCSSLLAILAVLAVLAVLVLLVALVFLVLLVFPVL